MHSWVGPCESKGLYVENSPFAGMYSLTICGFWHVSHKKKNKQLKSSLFKLEIFHHARTVPKSDDSMPVREEDLILLNFCPRKHAHPKSQPVPKFAFQNLRFEKSPLCGQALQ